MSDYHRAVTCDKCGKRNLKLIAPLRLHFQPHTQCQDCEHEELEIITFMRTAPDIEKAEARKEARALAKVSKKRASA